MIFRRSIIRGGSVLLMVVLNACASVPPVEPEPVIATRPSRILLRDFAVDPAAVRIDEAALAVHGRGPSAQALEEFRQIDASTARDMVATTLAFRLGQLGFDVERSPPRERADANALIIDGRLDRIDEGDRRLRRVNPDSGRAVVTGQLRVFYTRGGGEFGIAALQDGSDANRPPGLPGATAAEAAALAVGGVRARELLRASVSAESRRLGNAFADELKAVFAEKGWIRVGS